MIIATNILCSAISIMQEGRQNFGKPIGKDSMTVQNTLQGTGKVRISLSGYRKQKSSDEHVKLKPLPIVCIPQKPAFQRTFPNIVDALKENDTDHRRRDLAGFKTRRGELQSCLIAINLPLFFTEYHLRPQLHNSFPITQLKWSALACSLTLKSYTT